MNIDRDRTSKNRPTTERPADDLFARIGEAFEADAATVERIKIRARKGARPTRARVLESWFFRVAVATALTLLIAIGAWRFPSAKNPPLNLPDPHASSLEESAEEETEKPTLVITNASGYVTVQTGGSQWIVLPGDVS